MAEKLYEIAPTDSKPDLPRLVEEGSSVRDWESEREEIKKRFLEVNGGLPSPVPVNAEIVSVTEEQGYKRILLNYASYDGDRVTAYLLKPDGLREGVKYPAVIALHPTAKEGKDVSAGLCGKPGRQYGQELVKRGYIVLVPDVFTAGERIPPGEGDYETAFFYRKYPWWSAFCKMLYDHMQGIDFFSTLPEVDMDRIGAIGHSLGGYNAFILAAFDERIKAAVSSCGLSTIIGDSDPAAKWARSRWFVHADSLKKYFEKGCTPFDFHEVIALIAPRAYFNFSARQDKIFPRWESVTAAEECIKDVYGIYDAAEEVEFIMGEDGHDFPDEIRERAYMFLDRRLKK